MMGSETLPEPWVIYHESQIYKVAQGAQDTLSALMDKYLFPVRDVGSYGKIT